MTTSNYQLRQLLVQREALDGQIAAMQADMRESVLVEMKARIEEFGFTAFDLGLIKTQHIVKRGRKERGTFQPKVKPSPAPPLYRDPATGQTWSGRGKQPLWIEGERDDYRIGAA
jgi:DNA-binding protein H-NS